MKLPTFVVSALVAGGLLAAAGVNAYDGTKCKAAGNCWEPKPGYPEKVAGSKYDPKHDTNELAKQEKAIAAMNERNQKRWENFKKTGKFVYDVK
jgi:methanol dehydrogenase (cytochrome c) subunit 2